MSLPSQFCIFIALTSYIINVESLNNFLSNFIEQLVVTCVEILLNVVIEWLICRTKVYKILNEAGIDYPRYAILNREKPGVGTVNN